MENTGKMPEVSGWWWDVEKQRYTCYHSSGCEVGCPGCLEGSLQRARKVLDETAKVLNETTKELENENKWTEFYMMRNEELQSDLDKARERVKKLEDAFLPLAITHPHLVPEEFRVVAIQREKLKEIFGEVEDDEEQIPTVGT